MSLVFAGICCHAPGITGRPEAAKSEQLALLLNQFEHLKRDIEKLPRMQYF